MQHRKMFFFIRRKRHRPQNAQSVVHKTEHCCYIVVVGHRVVPHKNMYTRKVSNITVMLYYMCLYSIVSLKYFCDLCVIMLKCAGNHII